MARWLPALLTAAFVLSGSFKKVTALDFLPVDVTLLLVVVVAVIVIGWLLSAPVPQATHLVFLGFLLLIPAAFFTAPTQYGTEKALRLFTVTFLSMLAPVVLIRDWSDVRRHLIALAAATGVVVGGGLFNPELSSNYAGAPITTESVDTIGLGTAAAVVLVIATMALIWRAWPWPVALPIAGASVYVLLQSGSRGPLFSAILGVVVGSFLVRVRPSARRGLFFVVSVCVGVLVAFSLAPVASQQRIVDLLTGNTVGSVDNRVRLVEVALDQITLHPFGIGLGGFEAVAFGGYFYPHDLPLEVLAEAGVLFGGAFLVWMISCVVRGHRATIDFTGGTTFAALVCVIGKALVSGDLNDNRLTFYVLGIAFAAGSLVLTSAGRDDLPGWKNALSGMRGTARETATATHFREPTATGRRRYTRPSTEVRDTSVNGQGSLL